MGGIFGPLIDQSTYPWIVNGTTNVTVTNVVIDKNIVFFSTENSVFSEITIDNGTEIALNGDGNIITNTTVNYGGGLGVNGKNNVVSGNHINNCNFTYAANNPPPFGVAVGGSNNLVIGNYVIGTYGSAIDLGTSSNNIIFGNQIENNQVAVRTLTVYPQTNAENNTIYNNNFVNNLQSYHDDMDRAGPTAVSIWDYNTVGNYWSNYNGSDANGDGKGDTPYIIDANNQDHYPLMNPVDISHISNLPTSSPNPTPTTNPTRQPTNTPTSTTIPSPTVPEFQLLGAIPLLAIASVSLVFLKKRKNKLTSKQSFL